MQEKTNSLEKNKLSRGEIVLMAIVTPLIFCVTFGVSFFLIVFVLGGIGNSSIGRWVWGLGFFVILTFVVAWPLTIRKIFRKSKKTKILLIAMGFAVSTSALIIWILDKIPPLRYG